MYFKIENGYRFYYLKVFSFFLFRGEITQCSVKIIKANKCIIYLISEVKVSVVIHSVGIIMLSNSIVGIPHKEFFYNHK
jgi:hypothetical protein